MKPSTLKMNLSRACDPELNNYQPSPSGNFESTKQSSTTMCELYPRVRNEKIDINETNWTPNQYTEYLNLYIKTAKRAAPIP